MVMGRHKKTLAESAVLTFLKNFLAKKRARSDRNSVYANNVGILLQGPHLPIAVASNLRQPPFRHLSRPWGLFRLEVSQPSVQPRASSRRICHAT